MWERPKHVPFPNVWRRFKGKKEINGVIPTFWIQDIPLEDFDKVLHCLLYPFNEEEPLSIYSGLLEDEESMEETKVIWFEALKDKVGLICYMENPNKDGEPIFVGVNCTYRKTKDNITDKAKGKALRKILDTLSFFGKNIDPFKELNTDVLLGSMGLYVFPDYRGQNIGLELLRAREDLCNAIGIKASVTTFTATSSQILANKAGYKLFSEISYEDLEKMEPQLSFPGIQNHTKTMKYGYKVFQ